MILWD